MSGNDDQRHGKGSREGNHGNIINTSKRDTQKWADANALARRGSKKSRRETRTKGEEDVVSNPAVTVVQKAFKDEEDQQGLKNQSRFQPCSKGDASDDARIQKLEQEVRIIEEELKNESQLLWEEDEELYTNAVHTATREATAIASGTYRARCWVAMVSTKGILVPIVVPHTHSTCSLSIMLALLKRRTRTEVSAK
jgi:hypothetical protein